MKHVKDKLNQGRFGLEGDIRGFLSNVGFGTVCGRDLGSRQGLVSGRS